MASKSQVSVSDLTVPDDVRQSLRQTSSNLIDVARSLSITNDSEYQAAANFLTTVIRPGLEKVNALFDANIKRWHEGHKAAIADKKIEAKPFNTAKEFVEGLMRDYQSRVRQRQLEEQRKIAQALRDEAERQAIERATQLIESDDEQEQEQAVEIINDVAQGAIIPVTSTALPPAISRPVKAEGVAIKHYWRFNIINPHLVKPSYCSPNERLIQYVVTEKGKEAEGIVGGIEVFEKTSVASRSIT